MVGGGGGWVGGGGGIKSISCQPQLLLCQVELSWGCDNLFIWNQMSD